MKRRPRPQTLARLVRETMLGRGTYAPEGPPNPGPEPRLRISSPKEGTEAQRRSRGWKRLLERRGSDAPESRPAAFGLAPSLKSGSPLQDPPLVPASGFSLRSLDQLTRSPAQSLSRVAPPSAPRAEGAAPGGRCERCERTERARWGGARPVPALSPPPCSSPAARWAGLEAT